MNVQKLSLVAALLCAVCSPAYAGTKYDGTWNFKIQTTRGNCSANSSAVTIKDGKIKGTLLTEGQRFQIRGTVKDDGSVKGRFGSGVGSFKGQFAANSGMGEWRSRFACGGKIIINR